VVHRLLVHTVYGDGTASPVVGYPTVRRLVLGRNDRLQWAELQSTFALRHDKQRPVRDIRTGLMCPTWAGQSCCEVLFFELSSNATLTDK